jgi:hypothetical protein
MSRLSEFEIICVRQRGEARAVFFLVTSPKGMDTCEARHIEMLTGEMISLETKETPCNEYWIYVIEKHDVANVKLRIQSAGGVGGDQRFDVEELHDTNWESDFLDGMALIETEHR